MGKKDDIEIYSAARMPVRNGSDWETYVYQDQFIIATVYGHSKDLVNKRAQLIVKLLNKARKNDYKVCHA